jgi:hypothetical protein
MSNLELIIKLENSLISDEFDREYITSLKLAYFYKFDLVNNGCPENIKAYEQEYISHLQEIRKLKGSDSP